MSGIGALTGRITTMSVARVSQGVSRELREKLCDVLIEAGDQASVCLNLTEELVLTASKILPRFAVIKVMNNRMQTRTRAQAQYRQVS